MHGKVSVHIGTRIERRTQVSTTIVEIFCEAEKDLRTNCVLPQSESEKALGDL
jgi:hypothetical protein